jgi:starch synthase
MYSLRYGTVPIVHSVGGLADTVEDYAPGNTKSTGFVFREYTGTALLAAMSRALSVFDDRPSWSGLQVAGMRQDNSWDRSAREYVKLYERTIRNAGPGGTVSGI